MNCFAWLTCLAFKNCPISYACKSDQHPKVYCHGCILTVVFRLWKKNKNKIKIWNSVHKYTTQNQNVGGFCWFYNMSTAVKLFYHIFFFLQWYDFKQQFQFDNHFFVHSYTISNILQVRVDQGGLVMKGYSHSQELQNRSFTIRCRLVSYPGHLFLVCVCVVCVHAHYLFAKDAVDIFYISPIEWGTLC